MPVQTTNIPERTYTTTFVSPSTTLSGTTWKAFNASLTLSNAAKAQWAARNPDVVGELIIEQDPGDGMGWRHWYSMLFHVGDGDPNLVIGGKQAGLPGIGDDNHDGLTRQVRATVNVYTEDAAGTISLFPQQFIAHMTAATFLGAASLNMDMAPPSGTDLIVGAGLDSQELAVSRGAATGAGPYAVSLVNGLAQAHASGEPVQYMVSRRYRAGGSFTAGLRLDLTT